MSLQGLVGCLPFVGYNFLGFGSPLLPPFQWLHGVDSPGIRTSRRSVSCPRRLRRNTRSRVENLRPGPAPVVTVPWVFFFFSRGREVTWSSLGCLKLHVTACCHHEFSKSIRTVTSFSGGQNFQEFDLKRQNSTKRTGLLKFEYPSNITGKFTMNVLGGFEYCLLSSSFHPSPTDMIQFDSYFQMNKFNHPLDVLQSDVFQQFFLEVFFFGKG